MWLHMLQVILRQVGISKLARLHQWKSAYMKVKLQLEDVHGKDADEID